MANSLYNSIYSGAIVCSHFADLLCIYINKVRDGTLSTSYLSLCHNGQRKYNKGRYKYA